MLSSHQIQSMRLALHMLMTSTCAVLRKQVASDGYGGAVENWAPVGEVDCMVRQMPAAELQKAGKVIDADRWRIFLPADCDVTVEDRLRVGEQEFAVESLVADDVLLCKVAYCRRVP